MPDNQEQQRDSDVVAYTSYNGLRNDVTAERFSIGDLDVASNIDLDKTGRMARRAGYTRVGTGATHSLWANPQGTECYCMQGAVLNRVNADYSLTPLATLHASTHVSFWQVNERTFFSNGVDTGVVEQGAVRTWGVAPPTLPQVSTTVGAMPAGLYRFTMTFMREDGQESGAPLEGQVQVSTGAALQFTRIPVSNDPGVVAKWIYLSRPNGELLFRAIALLNQTTSAEYANDTTELNLELQTQFLQPAPAGQLITWYRGRMFVAVGDVIYPSEPFAHELFDLRAYIPLDGRVTLMMPIMDRELYDTGKNSGLFVGTDKSCGVLVGSQPEDFQYVPKTDYGAVFGAVAMVDGSVFQDGSAGARNLPMFITTGGLCVGLPELMIRNLTRTRFTFPVGTRGGAIFMPGPNRFIATSTS